MNAISSYQIRYLNRRGRRVWDFPLAGTTIGRLSPIVPASVALERPALTTDYESAYQLAQSINGVLSVRGLPGKCFAVLDAPLINLMDGCREIVA